MNKAILIERLCEFVKDATKDMLLPVKRQRAVETDEMRRAAVYKMRLPDSSSTDKKAPYIITQLVTGKDEQEEGKRDVSTAVIRLIFCVYCSDEQEGSMHLLNLMERVRIELLRVCILAGQFELNKKAGIEEFIYPDTSTAPYYMGELITNWKVPSVVREIDMR